MRIALVDDRAEDLALLRGMLEAGLGRLYVSPGSIQEFSSGEAFLEDFQAGKYDLVFLDIFMDGLNGIETAEHIRRTDKNAHLVFITTSNDFASESYAVQADYYLLKPYTQAQMDRMLALVLPQVSRTARTLTLPGGTPLAVDNILYTESRGHYIYFQCTEGKTPPVRMTQAELTEMLAGFRQFFSCMKGLTVNFAAIENITDTMVLLKNGERLPVSRRKYAELKKAYAAYTFARIQGS